MIKFFADFCIFTLIREKYKILKVVHRTCKFTYFVQREIFGLGEWKNHYPQGKF